MNNPLNVLHPRSLKNLTIHMHSLIRSRLWLKILVAMFLGIMTGILLGPTTGLVPRETGAVIGSWLAMPGQIFLGMIQMIVVPLVFASIITGLAASEDMEQLSKMGTRLAFYFVATTVVAIVIGLMVALTIQPGLFIDGSTLEETMGAETPIDQEEMVDAPDFVGIPEVITSILPQNPLGAMVDREMFQIVLIAIIFGIALISTASTYAEPLLELLGAIQEVCMTIVRWAMLLAPFAVFGMLAQTTITTGIDALLGMAIYVLTVLLGLLILLGVYMLLVMVVGRKNPLEFFQAVREVVLLAFSTSSSAAVMPLSIQVAEEKLGVRPSTSQFLIPLGATINMNGTALYQGVAAIFLAQVFAVELTLASMLLIIVMTVGASIGSSATPGVGMVILASVLASVGIPPSGIALIIGVDRILDMSRTAINVMGDLTACLVMDRWVGGPNLEQ
ncbi:dicarboxylate/amino acid:cation symporter [Dethiobacter alkaliphilus]|uniref:dicarboxylate/amino acid:cation symporter n=1 Tax=Dethiobacter alkaliphilus TaxID=427926 RepID=UPI0022277033|nr:dicarboxylate/amino acid:cation symporter [Dethiobacter alkaliphilus]MCW3489886.1 dicarboxylate/amino acid:cation symporter [Dethiobacter alkaliphilus]